LYGSVLPAGEVDLSVHAHAEDLQAVLDDAQITDATLIGWSMGVQVGLEFYSLKQSHVSRLVFISGTYGQPLKGLPLPFSGVALPHVLRRVKRFHHFGRKALNFASRSSLGYPLLRRLRLVAPGLSEAHYREMMNDFREVDLETYFDLLAHLGEHDAEHTLSAVTLPTLVVAGSRDLITPPWLSRRIAERIPHAELFMITGATHYSAAEYPEHISERVELFIQASSGD
jgi:pimeloyl-ACP methyl ester carboxylesterase